MPWKVGLGGGPGNRSKLTINATSTYTCLCNETIYRDDDVFLNDNDDDVFPDVPMAELAPKRTLHSSRSTDAKSSVAPVVDDEKKKTAGAAPGGNT